MSSFDDPAGYEYTGDESGGGEGLIWSSGGGSAVQEDEFTESSEGEEGGQSGALVGVESVAEYVPISNDETARAGEDEEASEEDEALLEALVDADYADEPEFFKKLIKILPKIVRGAGKVVRHPVVRTAVRGFLAAKGISLEAAAEATNPSLLEVVLGADDRVRIPNTAIKPWSGICQLNITAKNGQRFIGTGWHIAPRTIITAGHCVFIHSAGGFAKHIEVVPGRNASTRPFGSVTSAKLSTSLEWKNARSRNHDYGCIILPKAPRSPSGALPFCFNYAARTEAQIKSRALNLSGYPGDKGGITQWFHARMAKSVSAHVITYDIDTAGGQSGSPVWHLQNGVRTAVGIHTNGSPLGNSATRITPTIVSRFNTWKAAGA